MKFLVDAQLPPGLCGWLEAWGHEAIHVTSLANQPLSDVAIAEWAAAHDCVVVSKDEDFIRLRSPDRFALLWLRCGNISNRGLAAWLGPQWPDLERQLAAGERLIELV